MQLQNLHDTIMAKMNAVIIATIFCFATCCARVANFRGIPPEAKMNTVSSTLFLAFFVLRLFLEKHLKISLRSIPKQ